MRSYKVDVLIPTYKPDKDFAKLLRQLAQQSYHIRNIIIVNTDERYWNPGWEDIRERIFVSHITPEEFDHGGTRRLLAQSTDADIMVYMTQDAIPADDRLIEKLVECFAMPRIKAVYARQLPKDGCSTLERYTRAYNYPSESDIKDKDDLSKFGIKTFFCSNVCAAYERKTYEKLGGFVEKAVFNEDMIYGARLIQDGYAIAYAADAKVYHSHNYSCIRQFQRNFDLGVSQSDHPEIFSKYPSEGEGFRLVKKTASHVIQIHKPWLLFQLAAISGAKYMGYFFGKHYRALPNWLILRFTMNKNYWKEGV
ncbi:glycosyltransferase family 2 protein [Blautia liquoris]|mgnify:CR=1 FL=1|uniref:Glycosyltransferase family 2 protein n=1 Tax=Blautia liquoris TaxID=2779518 RepID=A0A7M2RIF5_9FIRM|nr:glycosyltransferase family 2 protein [Blautia liquoris]QOV20105.1 glycosyltransferase family 2 protein [Blautia liquoris]